MKLVLVHLSDIHIKESEKQNPVLSRAQAIAAAAASTARNARFWFVVITGDIAFSGKPEEYALAGNFFREIQDCLCTQLPECECRFVLVPGNHDCDFSQLDGVREFLTSKLTSEDLNESVYTTCIKVQANYEEFATRWRAETVEPAGSSKMYRREMYNLPEGTVEFRLINSAWMSTLKERPGSLLFPVELLQSDEDVGRVTDLVVTTLHHPYNWFEPTNVRIMRDEVEATSDIILTGHEHEGDHYRKHRSTGERTEYLEGEVLQDPDNPQTSLFHVIVIDLDDRMQQVHTFSWKSGRYESEGPVASTPFQRNRYRLRNEFHLSESFRKFLRDPGAKFTHPEKEDLLLDDLFVYPDLRRLNLPGENQQSTELVRDRVLTFILDHRHVLLVGPEKCGKTALSKTVFQDLRRRGFIPIHISGSEFKGYTEASVSSVIEQSFEKEYDSPNVDMFRQLEHTKKAVVVDDFHKSSVNSRGRDHIINTLESIFDVVILFGDEQLRFGDLITQEGEKLALWYFTHCEILPFGHLRRADLIEKWYFLGRRFSHNEYELSRLALQAEKTVSLLLGQNFVPSYPIFILIILQQMELRTPLETTATSGSYGFLYESLLTMALARSSRLGEDLDTQYTYLSEFAYYLFAKRAHSIGIDEALDWHQRHCDVYSLRLNFERILSDFCDASVLCNDGNRVSFRYPYIYYYFVGRYFRDHIGDTVIRNHISWMSKRLHHTESANILMFLSYLSKDPFILSSILEASCNLFSSHLECDLMEDTKFLTGLMPNMPQLVLDSSHPSERRRKLLAQKDELESARVNQEESKETDDELDQDKDLQEYFQINAAFKTIQILGQILRNFPGSLKSGSKLELAKECYSLGLRVLKYMLGSVEVGQEDILQLLAEFLRMRYPKWSDKRLNDRAKDFLFNLMEWFAFVVIKQVSDSVGLDKLSMTFKQLLREKDTISYRFIDISVRLDHYSDFPEEEVFRLDKDTQRNPFATRLLRHLVWYYFYICETRYDLRQKVCARLGIKLLPSVVHDQRVKRLKG